MNLSVPALLEPLRRFHRQGEARDLAFRLRQLDRLAAAISRHEDRILAALREDLGKPPLEAHLSEIGFTLQELEYTRRHLPRWARPRRVRTNLLNRPARCEIHPQARGVVLILGPWNYPFQLVLCPLISALAAGNTAVVKPSEIAPATAAVIEAVLGECFAPEYVRVVTGGPEVAEALLEAEFDCIFYTGNARVGRRVMAAAARHLTPVTLELGGKCPCVLEPDVKLERALRRIVRGKFFNAGQTCVAPDYLCLHASVYDAALDRLPALIEAFYGADPGRSPDYARIVNHRHFDRLTALLGGNVRTVGRHDRAQRLFAPTVLRDVGWNDPVMAEEIFGPILPCLRYERLDALLDEINRRPKPLALYLFTQDRAVQQQVLASTCSGGVAINETLLHITVPSLPFGGVGESGFGRYRGRYGFDTFSHYRSVMRKSLGPELMAAYPPYGRLLERLRPWLRWLRRF